MGKINGLGGSGEYLNWAKSDNFHLHFSLEIKCCLLVKLTFHKNPCQHLGIFMIKRDWKLNRIFEKLETVLLILFESRRRDGIVVLSPVPGASQQTGLDRSYLLRVNGFKQTRPSLSTLRPRVCEDRRPDGQWENSLL